MKVYLGDKIDGWKMYGIWFSKKVYVGVSIVITKE